MADDEIAVSWKDVEKMLDKGKTDGALELLRKVDPEGTQAVSYTHLTLPTILRV